MADVFQTLVGGKATKVLVMRSENHVYVRIRTLTFPEFASLSPDSRFEVLLIKLPHMYVKTFLFGTCGRLTWVRLGVKHLLKVAQHGEDHLLIQLSGSLTRTSP